MQVIFRDGVKEDILAIQATCANIQYKDGLLIAIFFCYLHFNRIHLLKYTQHILEQQLK